MDPTDEWTFQIGFTGTLQIPFTNFTLTGSIGYAINSQGNIAQYSSPGTGTGTGESASVSISGAFSNAQNVSDLSGPFGKVSATIAGTSVTVDAFAGNSSDGPVTGLGFSLGAGEGASNSESVTATYTYPSTVQAGDLPSNCSAGGLGQAVGTAQGNAAGQGARITAGRKN